MARPKEAILSRNLIRDQALAIIDEDGLDALTMRKLAARLGVQAASLYSHFPNKEAVLAAIADRLAKRIDTGGFAEGWQEGLRTWAKSYYSAMHWHPRAGEQVVDGSPHAPAGQLDQFADTIERASFSPALDSLIRGFESVYDEVGVVRSAAVG